MRGFRSSDRMHFKYHVDWVKEGDKQVPKHRPRIEIVLRKFSERYNPKTNPEFRTHGLIDSGADICFIPRKIADLLTLELKEATKKKSTGVNGKFWTYRTKMYLEILDKGRRIGIDTVEVVVPENDPDDIDLEKNILIGRGGLFENYEITFNEMLRFIILKKISKNRWKK